MREEDAGPLFTSIGEIILEGLGPLENRTLLYADVEEGSIGMTIAEDRGNYIFYHALSHEYNSALSDALVAFWRLRKEGERWREMTYLITNGRAQAELFYPDLLDPDERQDDRENRVIAEHFGIKPAQCDPFDDDPPGSYTFDL